MSEQIQVEKQTLSPIELAIWRGYCSKEVVSEVNKALRVITANIDGDLALNRASRKKLVAELEQEETPTGKVPSLRKRIVKIDKATKVLRANRRKKLEPSKPQRTERKIHRTISNYLFETKVPQMLQEQGYPVTADHTIDTKLFTEASNAKSK